MALPRRALVAGVVGTGLAAILGPSYGGTDITLDDVKAVVKKFKAGKVGMPAVLRAVTAYSDSAVLTQATLDQEIIDAQQEKIDELKAIIQDLLPAKKAGHSDRLVEFFGINALFKNRTSVYGNAPAVAAWMAALGVRHGRDRLVPGQLSQQAAYADLWRRGMSMHVTIGVLGDSDAAIEAALNKAAEHPEYYTSFGGPNEPNATGPGWVAKTIAHQKKIWDYAGSIPAISHIPIIGPALQDTSDNLRQDFADLRDAGIGNYCDVADFHRYPGGVSPTNGLDDRFEWAEEWSTSTSCTEGGYNNGVGITGHGKPIPEYVSAVYAPRQILEIFDYGGYSFYMFELLDDPDPKPFSDWESHFGLIRCPSLDPATWEAKPAFSAVRDLLAELSDPGPEYNPDPLPLVVDNGGNDALRWVLFGKRNRSYRLILWLDVSVYDVQDNTPIDIVPADVTVTTLNGSQSFEVDGNIKIITL